METVELVRPVIVAEFVVVGRLLVVKFWFVLVVVEVVSLSLVFLQVVAL